jgi:GNAT superfamily N-acetyltransferase
MTASPLLCSDELLAVELGFWIKPEYRNRETIRLLLKAFQTWAKKVGCKGTLMAKIKNRNAPEQYVCRRIN